MRGLAETVAAELGQLRTAPNQVCVELGVNVTAKSQVFIANAAAQGSIKITLTWNGPPDTAAGGPAQ